MYSRYDVLKLINEKSSISLSDIPTEHLTSARALITEMEKAGLVVPSASRSGPFSLTETGKAVFLELQAAVDKEVQQRTREKRSQITQYAFNILMFALGLVAEHFAEILQTILDFLALFS